MSFFDLSFMGKSKKIKPIYWEVTLQLNFVRYDFESTLPKDKTCDIYHTWINIMKKENPTTDQLYYHMVSPCIDYDTNELKTRYLELIRLISSSQLLHRYIDFDSINKHGKIEGNLNVVFVIEPQQISIHEYEQELNSKLDLIHDKYDDILGFPCKHDSDITLGEIYYTASIKEMDSFKHQFQVKRTDNAVKLAEESFNQTYYK